MLALDEPGAGEATEAPVGADGAPHPYFFVGKEGASAYASFDLALEGTPDHDLEAGWGVAVAEQRVEQGERWARTTKSLWVAMRDLVAAPPTTFRGQAIDGGALDVAWVVADRALVWASATATGKPVDALARFAVVRVLEEVGRAVRVGPDRWMLARDLTRPALAPPPAEATRGAGERWIDIDLASQTLVAYEGARPVYATLVSSGRGPKGSDSATPPGVHRIWVKLVVSDMANTTRDDIDARYSLEDVPYVQFFDGAVGLHGTYWHRDFGRVRSHGCVNLAPLDARWLFGFTEPRLPRGWAAAYPTELDEGSLVRVR
jgi:lipoprotein-anchoring transpeptidase ErfK/SrfK